MVLTYPNCSIDGLLSGLLISCITHDGVVDVVVTVVFFDYIHLSQHLGVVVLLCVNSHFIYVLGCRTEDVPGKAV